MMSSPHKRPSILVVDDTPDNIDVLREALKQHYIIRPALDGATALKIASASPKPNLILLDIKMPGMDGYEVARRLQADNSTREIPIIFVTAASDIKSELKGLDLGAVDYITKPFNPDIVRKRVSTHLELRDEREKLLAIIDNMSTNLKPLTSTDQSWQLILTQSELVPPKLPPIALTNRELLLLHAMADADNQQVDRDNLIKALGKNPLYYDPRALEVCMSRLRQKLPNLDNGNNPLQAVRGVGYKFLRPLVVVR